LKGVWTLAHNAGCRTTVQFLYRNYLALNTGDSCSNGAFGMFIGTYSLADNIIFVQYASVPLAYGNGPMHNSLNATISPNGMTLTLSSLMMEWTAVFTKLPPDASDGVWSGNTQNGGSVVIHLESNLYTAYVTDQMDGTDLQSYYGIMEFPTESNGTITYADWNTLALGGNVVRQSAHYKATEVERTIAGGQVRLHGMGEMAFDANLTVMNPPDTALDGVWTMAMGGQCQTTVQFYRGVYRSFNTGSVECKPNVFLGTYTKLNSTHIRVSYSFSNIKEFEGETVVFNFIKADSDHLRLVGWQQVSGGMVDISLLRADNPPPAVYMDVVLNGNFSTFNQTTFPGSQEFVQSGIQGYGIVVVSAEAGSIKLKMAITADQNTGKTVADQFGQLTAKTSIGGYPLGSVKVLSGTLPQPTTMPPTGPTPTNNGAPTNGTKTSSASAAACSLMLLVASIFFHNY